MYTGGNPILPDILPKRDETESPGPDQPVGAIKPNDLTDDNLKVTNGSLITFIVIGITGEPSRFIVINQLC